MGAAPFNGSADQTLSVGYISGFLFVGVVRSDFLNTYNRINSGT
jgi:hypothetical protein